LIKNDDFHYKLCHYHESTDKKKLKMAVGSDRLWDSFNLMDETFFLNLAFNSKDLIE